MHFFVQLFVDEFVEEDFPEIFLFVLLLFGLSFSIDSSDFRLIYSKYKTDIFAAIENSNLQRSLHPELLIIGFAHSMHDEIKLRVYFLQDDDEVLHIPDEYSPNEQIYFKTTFKLSTQSLSLTLLIVT